MPPSPSPLLFLLLLHTAAAEDCRATFRLGQENFVLDAEDAVKEGAALLATARVSSEEACKSACCADARCNLVLLEPRQGTAGAENRTCDLFDCVHRNSFVCRFVNKVGYLSYIRETEFLQHLQGPQTGERAPPIAIADRDVIVQPAAKLTLNGIQSLALDDAHITKYSWTLQGRATGVHMQETELPDQVRLSILQPGSYSFLLTVTDSNDRSDSAEVRVLVLSPELTSLYCLAPLKVGPCRAAFPRWRYDAPSGRCQPFVFGGCKPNNNNFLSEEECVSACSGVTASSERSSLPAAECGGAECVPGQLSCGSCCLHRSLECDGVQQCRKGEDEEPCSKLNETFSRLLDIEVNQRKARCAEPPLPGLCRASFTRWYYDPLNRKCFRFTYGGCKGSANNFEEEENCSTTCRGVTGNIALAVCLSVAILALLAILTYCFLKSRKERSHRPAAAGPAHMALSEQDTFVYNSTTKPIVRHLNNQPV
ncbi:kunitz-type protease inhibitor 1-like isoform X2 [Eleginops maclovinus]|uniref:kunitz-type protease inhibitor 1-like isoform X2 n=1 Tax=Eleginops maclovinus TaxID=56733 RepID=UPI0030802CD1